MKKTFDKDKGLLHSKILIKYIKKRGEKLGER